MDKLEHLVREVHRRSLWQVLGIYLVGGWAALEAVGGITEAAGLPDWVPPFALVLLVIGLPIVLATAVVQEGGPGSGGPGDDTGSDRGAGGASGPPPPNLAAGTGSLDRPSTRPGFLVRNLTWRRAILGGVLAFALLGVAVAGYFVLWSQGIGAVGSLKAQGVFEEGERVVLADFSDRSGGAGLGPVVTEALRIDLVESPNLDPVSSDQVAEILERMELAEGAALGASVAREVAVRGGFKAVIEGDVSAAGSGFILTASIRDVQTGRPLAAFRETAGDEAAVIAAIDKLSQRIREKAGESLRSIKSGPELERVTTSSLEALRTFTRAHEAFERGADEDALALLEDAVALDPDFAMAWRLIAVIHQNTRLDPQAQREATVRAWELRDRLPSVERHLAEAVYHSSVTGDRDETIRAYESVLRIDPDHRAAVNNLAAELFRQGELARAEGILRRAVTGPAESRAVWANLVLMLAFQRKFAAAEEALAGYGERYPQDGTVRSMRNRLAMIQDRPQAETLSRAVLEDDEARPLDRIHALDDLAQAAVREGKLGEAREHFRAALEEAQRVSPALGWLRRLWWAQAEAVLGDPARIPGILGADRSPPLWEGLPAESRDPLALGIVAFLADDVEGTTRALDQARTLAEELGPEDPWVLPLLQALSASLRGAHGDAVSHVERARALVPDPQFFAMERALVLDAAGRTREAIDAYEEARTSVRLFVDVVPVLGYGLVAIERLGPAYEAVGDTTRAVEAYRAFAEQWADADPELQPRVRRAWERAAALTEGA